MLAEDAGENNQERKCCANHAKIKANAQSDITDYIAGFNNRKR